MKLLIDVDSSPYPGVTILAEQRDMVLLGECIKKAAEAKNIGVITIADMNLESEHYEWIRFETVKNINDTRKVLKSRQMPIKLILAILFLLFAALCYLAYRGLSTF